MNDHLPKSNPYASPGSFGFTADYKQLAQYEGPLIVVEGRVEAPDVGLPSPSQHEQRWWRNPGTIALFALVAIGLSWVAVAQQDLRILALVVLAIFGISCLVSVIRDMRRPNIEHSAPSTIFDDRWFRITFVRAACEIRRENAICIYRWDALYVTFQDDGMTISERRQERIFPLQFLPKRCFKEGDWERTLELIRLLSGRPS